MDQNDNVLFYNLGAYGKYDVAQNKKFYYLKDHLANIRATIDATGSIVSSDDYYPFGLEMPGRCYTGNNPHNFYKYSGKELDKDKNLNWYYFEARYYDPVLGRFTAVDPLGQQTPAWNPYRYGFNNPYKYTDPTGMSEEGFWGWLKKTFSSADESIPLSQETQIVLNGGAAAKEEIKENTVETLDKVEETADNVEEVALDGAIVTSVIPGAQEATPVLLTVATVADMTGTVASGLKAYITEDSNDQNSFMINMTGLAVGGLAKKANSLNKKINTKAKENTVESITETLINYAKGLFE